MLTETEQQGATEMLGEPQVKAHFTNHRTGLRRLEDTCMVRPEWLACLSDR
jgi:hypothetical protein